MGNTQIPNILPSFEDLYNQTVAVELTEGNRTATVDILFNYHLLNQEMYEQTIGSGLLGGENSIRKVLRALLGESTTNGSTNTSPGTQYTAQEMNEHLSLTRELFEQGTALSADDTVTSVNELFTNVNNTYGIASYGIALTIMAAVGLSVYEATGVIDRFRTPPDQREPIKLKRRDLLKLFVVGSGVVAATTPTINFDTHNAIDQVLTATGITKKEWDTYVEVMINLRNEIMTINYLRHLDTAMELRHANNIKSTMMLGTAHYDTVNLLKEQIPDIESTLERRVDSLFHNLAHMYRFTEESLAAENNDNREIPPSVINQTFTTRLANLIGFFDDGMLVMNAAIEPYSLETEIAAVGKSSAFSPDDLFRRESNRLLRGEGDPNLKFYYIKAYWLARRNRAQLIYDHIKQLNSESTYTPTDTERSTLISAFENHFDIVRDILPDSIPLHESVLSKGDCVIGVVRSSTVDCPVLRRAEIDNDGSIYMNDYAYTLKGSPILLQERKFTKIANREMLPQLTRAVLECTVSTQEDDVVLDGVLYHAQDSTALARRSVITDEDLFEKYEVYISDVEDILLGNNIIIIQK